MKRIYFIFKKQCLKNPNQCKYSLDTKLKVGNYLGKFGESRTFKHDIMCIGKVIYYIIMQNEYREGFKDLKKELPNNYKCLRKTCIDC